MAAPTPRTASLGQDAPDGGTMFAALRLPRQILFGAGQRAAVPRILREYGSRVFVVADPFVAETPDFRRIVDTAEGLGLSLLVFTDVVPDLPVACVETAVERAREFGADVMLGFGGGSSIDLAKVTALLLAHGGSVADYYGEFRVPGAIMPVIAVPTTAGTGSEVTPVAVLNDPARTSKVGISSPHLIPVAAVCDPELTYSCPPGVTASSGADAVTHAVEALTAVRRRPDAELTGERVFVGRGELTDLFATAALRHLFRGLPVAYREPENAEARAAVMMGSLLAGLAFGTAGTGAAHAIQYPVGALTHTPHGVGVGALLPYVMRFNRDASEPEFATIGRLLGSDATDDASAAASAADAVAALLRSIGIPATLAELGMPSDRTDWAAAESMNAARLVENNPRELTPEAARLILQAALTGDRDLTTTEIR